MTAGPTSDAASRPDRDRNRDRDRAGRPRNARPRDGLGRPLDRAAAGQPTVTEDPELTQRESVRLAQQLIDDGRPFHAHEVLEAEWKRAPDGERELWRGLAQVAVGLTHARRGNAPGAIALLRRGAAAMERYPAPGPGGVDPPAVRQAALAVADRIERAGLGSVTPADLTIRLTG